MTKFELVVDEGDGEELVAEGTEAHMEQVKADLLAEYEPDGNHEGRTPPPYRVQRAA